MDPLSVSRQSLVFFVNSNGYPTTVLGVGRDITERKRMEAQARDLLEFNGKILNHSPLGILTYKLTGECVFANEIATSIIDARMEDFNIAELPYPFILEKLWSV